MIPSKTWFPLSLQERAAWFENFATQFSVVGAGLGFTPAEVAAVEADNDIVEFLASAAVAIEAYKDAIRQYRIIVTEGSTGDPIPSFPADPALTPPPGALPGLFERLDSLVKRIRVAPSYTPEAGALLGIIPSKPDPIAPVDLKPVIKAGDSFGEYKYQVDATRLGQPAYRVEIQRKGESNWETAGVSLSNPFLGTLTPSTPGDPERVYVRAWLLGKNNEPVGEPSDPTYVTVNP
jgi:hypothetical protein